jgi:hypothetical protein
MSAQSASQNKAAFIVGVHNMAPDQLEKLFRILVG